MVLARNSFDPIPLAAASVSVGYGLASLPTLQDKVSAIAEAGFKGMELAFPDLLAFAKSHHGRAIEANDYDALTSAAEAVKKICDEARLEIMLLQPFANFEGWGDDSLERKDAFERAKGWIKIMVACGCANLQVGSSDSPEEKIGTDRARFVADLSALADLLAEEGLYLAYENWCWSTHAPNWKDAWDIVRSVNKANIGLCLDTFQIAGGEWADPSTESGVVESDDLSREQLQKRFENSMLDLLTTVGKEKIYLLQISDAYRLSAPMNADEEHGANPRSKWSMAYRPAPFNGGYLPVVDVVKAVLKTGFRGWFSYETFDKGADGKGKDYKLDSFAKELYDSHVKLMEECIEEDESKKKKKDDDK